MTKKLATFLKNNDIYLAGTSVLIILFATILFLLSVIAKDINWTYASLAVGGVGLLILVSFNVLGIFGIIDAVKERKLKKAKQ